MSHNQALGRWGEDAAAQWYEQAGYVVLERNWRSRAGELDLIVGRADEVVFVEVKTRSTTAFGGGAEAVGWRKQKTIRSVARSWLAQSDRFHAQLRFDVVVVEGEGGLCVYEACF